MLTKFKGRPAVFRVSLPVALLLALVAMQPAPSGAQDRAPPTAAYSEGLPEDFHGKVSYFGNYSGTQSTWKAEDGRRPSLDCKEGAGCGNRIGGSLQIDLEFDGVVVRGSFRGSGGLHDSGLIGRRQGGSCRLFDLTDGSVWIGKCDSSGFKGEVHSVPNAASQLSVAFEAVGTRTNDYAERDRLRREALQAQRRIEFLRSVIAGSAPLDERVLSSIELDSYSWPYDKLRPQTMSITRRGRPRGGTYEVQFELAGGGRGWAHAQIANGSVSCIEFWDYPGKCRAVNQPPPIDIDAGYEDPARTSFRTLKELVIPRAAYDLGGPLQIATK